MSDTVFLCKATQGLAHPAQGRGEPLVGAGERDPHAAIVAEGRARHYGDAGFVQQEVREIVGGRDGAPGRPGPSAPAGEACRAVALAFEPK